MNTYRVRYIKGQSGFKLIEADSVNGFKPQCDSYVFKIGSEVVAAVPKSVVVSVEKIGSGEDVDG